MRKSCWFVFLLGCDVQAERMVKTQAPRNHGPESAVRHREGTASASIREGTGGTRNGQTGDPPALLLALRCRLVSPAQLADIDNREPRVDAVVAAVGSGIWTGVGDGSQKSGQ